MESRLKRLLDRFKEVEHLMGLPETMADQPFYKQLAKEHSYLLHIKEVWEYHQKINSQLIENQVLLLSEKDPELIAVIKDEIEHLERQCVIYSKKLENLLVPPDPNDDRSVILELRAGTGGDEAGLFVGDCARMYRNFADRQGWRCETLATSPSEKGGFKEYIVAIAGTGVHRLLQYEAGTHRVQRVPETEAQGRLHTSAITVAVLMEPSAEEKIAILEKDLRIDTYRASGAGGQHVNTTDSAVRITHIPTGTVVCCQDERSQHKNKDKAMRILSVKIAEELRRKEDLQQSSLRSQQVGSGDRSERIRTYNFPQNRITDHRINLTLYNLDQVIAGDLEDITTALVTFYYQQKLTI